MMGKEDAEMDRKAQIVSSMLRNALEAEKVENAPGANAEVKDDVVETSLDELAKALEIFEILYPYMKAELADHPELYETEKTFEESGIIAASAKRAREDGKRIPFLKAENLDIEQIEMPLGNLSSPNMSLSAINNALLPVLQAIMPRYHTSPNTRLSNEMKNGDFINDGKFDFVVANAGKWNELTTSVIMTYDPSDGVNLPSNKVFSEYDRQVYDGICSLWMYGDKAHLITPAIVYRAMTGTDGAPSAQQKKAITTSIEKARRIFANIDATAEVNDYLKKQGAEVDERARYPWNDAILSATKIEAKNGKKVQEVYCIKSEPLLLSYSRATHKLLTSPTNLLDIKRIDSKGKLTTESIANNESRIAIKGYLWRRIMLMKNDEKKAIARQKKSKDKGKNIADFRECQRAILFKTIFTETNQASDNREIQRRNRDYVFQVLDFFVAMGQITGYSKRTGAKGSISGVVITV